MDNNIGYEKYNVVPSCGTCNFVKGDEYNYEEMLEIANVIRSIHNKRENVHFLPVLLQEDVNLPTSKAEGHQVVVKTALDF